jgi:hypothetical protein
MILTRPFKYRVFNHFFICIEIFISVCYSASGCLIFSEQDEETLMWTMLEGVYISYLLHSLLGYYKICIIIFHTVKGYFRKKTMRQKDGKDPQS